MSVLLLPPIFQFFDNNGDPLANGFVYTYAAGTTTPLATYTNSSGTIAAPNPIELNAAGRPTSGSGAIWGEGAYKFIVKDSSGVQVGDALDNVTSFTTLASSANAYFESFSGNGTQTVFTTSSDLGTEEKGLMVFVSNGLQEIAVNGTFVSDTDWTKGAGWTIAAGVATATGAISTAISQVPTIPLVAGQAYAVTYTITRSAGGLIPSLGGQNGTERTASGTYREIIIAAATTPTAFTGNAFTGTLDSVSITRADAQGYDILSPSAYTINGTTLTFASAPATGTNNIYVFAPSLLLGAASAAATLAQGYAAAALTSETNAAGSASSAAAYALAKVKWTYSSTTTMADPSTGNVRFNNATLSSVTAIAIADQSADSGNPDLSAWINTWDDGSGSNRGTIYVFKDNSNFRLYAVNSANTDNTTWNQVSVTHISGSGSFTNGDALYLGFAASGTTTVTGGITALTGDVTASGSGSVAATIANNAVTLAKMATQAALTVLTNATNAVANPTAFALAAKQFLVGNDDGTALVAGSFGGGLSVASGVVSGAGVISSGYSGSVNNSSSGSGADVDMTPSYTIPANYLTAGKILRVTVHYRMTSGSAPPTILMKLKAGSTVLATHAAATPQASMTNVQGLMTYLITATAAPSASSPLECAGTITTNAFGNTLNLNTTAMPVNVATNGSLVLQASTQWSAVGTGTNTITLSQFVVEALN
jgi:hypothetical protein